MTAQAMRAILLAAATVTSQADLRSRHRVDLDEERLFHQPHDFPSQRRHSVGTSPAGGDGQRGNGAHIENVPAIHEEPTCRQMSCRACLVTLAEGSR